MLDPKKGKGVSLLLALGKKSKPDPSVMPKDDDMGSEMEEPSSDKYSMACDDLADVLGVAEDKKADLASALKRAIAAYGSEEREEGEAK